MKRKRFSVEQIVGVLKQAELGVPVAELIRQVGITEQTLYHWKKKYKGLETDQVRQFKRLQDENARLDCLVAGVKRILFFPGTTHHHLLNQTSPVRRELLVAGRRVTTSQSSDHHSLGSIMGYRSAKSPIPFPWLALRY